MANRFWVGGGSSTSWGATVNTNWGTASNTQDNASVPTAADDVFFDGVGTGASDAASSSGAVCRSLNCTGYANTLTMGFSISIGDATAGASNIALKLATGMTITTTGGFAIVSTSTTQQTIDTAGKSVGNITFSGVGGNWLLSAALTSVGTFTHTGGTFATGNFAISASTYSITGTNVRVFSPGTSVITSTNTGVANVWNATTITNLTFNGSTMTFTITGGTGSTRTFIGGGLTYGTLNYTIGSSAGLLIITGSNTFDVLNVTSPSSNHPLRLTAGTTTTIGTTFNVNGRSGAVMVFDSSSAGSQATVSKVSGTVTIDYVNIKDIEFTGGATWIAGSNSVDGGGNSGITFPSGGKNKGSDGSMFFFFN